MSVNTMVVIGRSPRGPEDLIPVSITIDSTGDVADGATLQLTVAVHNSRGQVLPGFPVDWHTNAPSIATVDSNGLVTGVSTGTAHITATITSPSITSNTCVITETGGMDTTPASIAINSNVSVSDGGTAQLTWTVYNAAMDILAGVNPDAWHSNDTGVATVSGSGLVTGVAAGTAHITATITSPAITSNTCNVTETGAVSDLNALSYVTYSPRPHPTAYVTQAAGLGVTLAAFPEVIVQTKYGCDIDNVSLGSFTTNSTLTDSGDRYTNGANLTSLLNSLVGTAAHIKITLPDNFLWSGLVVPKTTAGNFWRYLEWRSGRPVAEGVRISPSDLATAPGSQWVASTDNVTLFANGCHRIRFVNLRFLPNNAMGNVFSSAVMDTTPYPDLGTVFANHTDRIIFDQCEFAGGDSGDGSTSVHQFNFGLRLESTNSACVDSYIHGIAAPNNESKAFLRTSAGSGFKIDNNYMESAACGIFLGGAGPMYSAEIGVVAAQAQDGVIRRNDVTSKVEWLRTGQEGANDYHFSTSTSAPPALGEMRYNSGTFASVTHIYINKIDLGSNTLNIAKVIVAGGVSGMIEIQKDSDGTFGRFVTTNIASVGSGGTAYWDLTVTPQSGAFGGGVVPGAESVNFQCINNNPIWDKLFHGVKNRFECKNVSRVICEGNTWARCVADGQSGWVVTIKSSADGFNADVGDGIHSGAGTFDLTFRWSWMSQGPIAYNFQGVNDNPNAPIVPGAVEAKPMQRISWYDTVADEIGLTYGSQPQFPVGFSHGGVEDLYYVHNTVVSNSDADAAGIAMRNAYPGSSYYYDVNINGGTYGDEIQLWQRPTVFGNIVMSAFYFTLGYPPRPGGNGDDAMVKFADSGFISKNVFMSLSPANDIYWPPQNALGIDVPTVTTRATSLADMAFVDLAGRDYTLTSSSPGYQADSGRDLGADYATVLEAIVGIPT